MGSKSGVGIADKKRIRNRLIYILKHNKNTPNIY